MKEKGLLRSIAGAVWRTARQPRGLADLVLYAFLVIHFGMWAILMWIVVPVALVRFVLWQ